MNEKIKESLTNIESSITNHIMLLEILVDYCNHNFSSCNEIPNIEHLLNIILNEMYQNRQNIDMLFQENN